MNDAHNHEENRVLDEIIARRRSVRAFKTEAPPDASIKQIISAGLQAPYAGLAAKENLPYRLFRVVRQGPVMTEIEELIKEQAGKGAGQVKAEMAANPRFKENGGPFLARIEDIAAHGIPTLNTVPFFIVVAERKGIPPVEVESLAHCLENMWLKATALSLGFQLLSVTKMLSQSQRFFEIARLDFGKFELNGCAVGYPLSPPGEKHLFSVDDVAAWI